MKTLIIALGALASISAFAKDDPYQCNFENVHTLSLPLFPEKADSPRFDYRYQTLGNIDPDQPVIIYLPGGPGASSMTNFNDPVNLGFLADEGLPVNVAKIFFDPRTVGCNRGDDKKFPDSSLTSFYLAGDVLAVINSLKLKKYILYGFSYGSQWATYVAARASAGEAPLPTSVVLGGILGIGKVDGSLSFPAQNEKEWELLKTLLPDSVVKILSEPKPLGFDASTWGGLIRRGLKRGTRVVNGVFKNQLLEQLKTIEPTGLALDENLKKDLSMSYEDGPFNDWDFSERLFAKIDCHEFSPNDGESLFSGGKFSPDPNKNPCAGEAFDRLYDSATLPIYSPIYYLAGTNDTAAPFIGAFYHFQNQTHAHRNFIEVPGGGHSTIGRVFPDCKEKNLGCNFKTTGFRWSYYIVYCTG